MRLLASCAVVTGCVKGHAEDDCFQSKHAFSGPRSRGPDRAAGASWPRARNAPRAVRLSTIHAGPHPALFSSRKFTKKIKKTKKISGQRRPMLVSRPTIACPQRPMRRRRRAWRRAVGPTAAPCPPCRRPGRAPGCVRCALQCPARAWSRLRALARTACARRSGCVVSAP